MTRRGRYGFSLVELLVVIAILSILLLLLMPALSAVREMGRRTQCFNSQRNIVMAMVNYESAHGAFPAAVPLCDDRYYNSLGREADVSCMGPNWASQILSLIDERTMYNDLVQCMSNQWHASDDCESQQGQLGRETPSYLVCPSAPPATKLHRSDRTQLANLSKGNYAACLGAENYSTALETRRRGSKENGRAGVMAVVPIANYPELVRQTRRGKINGEWKIAHGQGISTKKISDGLTRTVVLSEIVTWDGGGNDAAFSEDLRGVWVSPSMGASTYTHKYGPNSQMPDRLNACDTTIPHTHALFCEQIRPTGEDSAETWASARSAHRNGVVAASADGSVQFFADDIFLPVWQAYATRSGGEL